MLWSLLLTWSHLILSMFLNIWALYRCCFHKSRDNDLLQTGIPVKCFKQAVFKHFQYVYGLQVYMAGQMDGCVDVNKIYITKQPVTLDTKITWVLKTPCAELGTFFEIKFWMLHFTFCCSHLITRWRLYLWCVMLHSHGIRQLRDGRRRTLPRWNKKNKQAVWWNGRTEKRYTWQYVAMVMS